MAQYEKQAEATARLVRLTAEAQKQADAEKLRVAAPRLVPGGGSWSQNVEIKLRNVGAEAHDVALVNGAAAHATASLRAVLKRGDIFDIWIERLGSEARELTVACADVYGNPYRFKVKVDGARTSISVMEDLDPRV